MFLIYHAVPQFRDYLWLQQINKNVCEKLGITRSLCASYHPQTNGLVERINGTIQRSLSKPVRTKPDTWDDYLDSLMFGLRTKKQMTTKFSPYYLMFGREARYPIEIPENYQIDSRVEEVIKKERDSQSFKLLDDIKYKINVSKAQGKSEKLSSASSRKVCLNIGHRVIKKKWRNQKHKGGKLEPNILGPFIITFIQGKSAKFLGVDGTVFKSIRVEHLKHFKQQNPQIPQKVPISHAESTTTTSVPTSSAPTTSAPTISASTPVFTTTSAPTSSTPAASVSSASVPTVLEKVWSGTLNDTHVMLSKIGPYRLFCWDFARIGPGQELESEVINAYLQLMVKKYNQKHQDQAALIDSFEMTWIWNEKMSSLQIDPEKYGVMVGIVNESHHWMLVVRKQKLQLNTFLKFSVNFRTTYACMCNYRKLQVFS
ncbi:uncharacterized protein LOC124879232 [Girardinichthys multiradiatus]|uniref:uncharacterized protein LOC124879232 n=1 Tax=Girardinichthys multiradiatus TaxID=208333 RepID=UPI001FAC8599|nr:uncharacterized protein LOC124879232 [Girardinichthys multiradiatus]